MKVRVLALDFDGTIAVDGRLDGEVPDAIRDARQADVMTVLVSERMLADVQALLPAPDLFGAIVAEVLPAHGENVLVSGDPRSGKSWVAGLAAECLIGREILLRDPSQHVVRLRENFLRRGKRPFVPLPRETAPAMLFSVSSTRSSPSGLGGHRLARNAKPAFEQPTTVSDAMNRRRRESVRDGRSERGGDCGVRSDGRPGGRRNVPGASRRRHMSGRRAVLTLSPREYDAVLFDLDGVLNIWNAKRCIVK